MEHLFSRTFVTSSLRSLDPGGIKKTSWQTEVSMLLVSVLRFLLVERWCHDSALHSTLRFSFYSPKHKVWVHEKKWIFRAWRYCRHTLPKRQETLKESWKSVLYYLLTISPLRLRIRGSKDVGLFVSDWERNALEMRLCVIDWDRRIWCWVASHCPV